MTVNKNMKAFFKENGVCQWQVAAAVNMGESTFTRMMRYPLSAEMERRVREAVEQIKKEAI